MGRAKLAGIPKYARRVTLWSGIIGGLFALLGACCVVLVVIGLPGAWIMVAIAVVTDLLVAPSVGDGQPFFGWLAIGIGAGIALAGEVIETLAAAEGARRGGATKRGAIGAAIGGIIGALAGTILIPVPLVGSLIGAALGAVAGAVIGEVSRDGVRLRDTAKPATGAAIGKVLGTIAKIPCVVVVWLMLTVAAVHHVSGITPDGASSDVIKTP